MMETIDMKSEEVASTTQVTSSTPQAHTHVDPVAGMLTILDRVANMPDFDADKLIKLFEIQQNMIERQQEVEFNRDMALAQREIELVVVNRKNPHTSSVFADISAIHAAAKPKWTERGFSVVSYAQPCGVDGLIEVVCQVRHRGGHKVEFKDTWPLDNMSTTGKVVKTDIQGKGSTLTYARRYMELGIFDVAISRWDKDGNAATIKDVETSDETANKLAALGISVAKKD